MSPQNFLPLLVVLAIAPLSLVLRHGDRSRLASGVFGALSALFLGAALTGYSSMAIGLFFSVISGAAAHRFYTSAPAGAEA